MTDQPTVVIIGGGYGGVNVAKALDADTTAIIVPIGPKLGSGQLPNQEALATRELVSAAKGQDLMVERYAEILGVVKPGV